MTNANDRWTEARLISFLQDPQSVVPGTSMPDPFIDDPRVLEKLVTILKQLKAQDVFIAR